VWDLSRVALGERKATHCRAELSPAAPFAPVESGGGQTHAFLTIPKSHIILPANFQTSLRQIIEEDLEPCKCSREVVINHTSGAGREHW